MFEKLKKWWNPHYPYKMGYKVVDINLRSSCPTYGKSVQYGPDLTTKRPENTIHREYGPLYVFKCLIDAEDYVNVMTDLKLEIWTCRYLSSKDRVACSIRGKRFADEVTLLERVS